MEQVWFSKLLFKSQICLSSVGLSQITTHLVNNLQLELPQWTQDFAIPENDLNWMED